MKVYARNARFWESVRLAVVYRAELWSRGSEGRTLMQIAMSDDWLEIFQDHAPASPRLSADDVAAVIIYRLLSEEA